MTYATSLHFLTKFLLYTMKRPRRQPQWVHPALADWETGTALNGTMLPLWGNLRNSWGGLGTYRSAIHSTHSLSSCDDWVTGKGIVAGRENNSPCRSVNPCRAPKCLVVLNRQTRKSSYPGHLLSQVSFIHLLTQQRYTEHCFVPGTFLSWGTAMHKVDKCAGPQWSTCSVCVEVCGLGVGNRKIIE